MSQSNSASKTSSAIHLSIALLVALIGVAAFLLFQLTQTNGRINKEIQAELDTIQTDIEKAQADYDGYAGGAIKQIIAYRLEVSKLTRTMLEQRKQSLLNNITMKYTVEGQPVLNHSRESLGAIESEIQQTAVQVEETKKRVDQYSGGLLQAVVLMELETHRMTLAQLRLQYVQAKYGFPLPLIKSQDSNDTEEREIVSDEEAF